MNIFDLAKSLNLPLGQYVIAGSGAMAAHGIRDFNDIDIFVTPELFEELKKKGWKEKPNSWGTTSIVNGIFDASPDIIFAGTYRPDIQKVIREADIINGIPFIKLEELITFKKVLSREKDLKDIKLIEEYLQKAL